MKIQDIKISEEIKKIARGNRTVKIVEDLSKLILKKTTDNSIPGYKRGTDYFFEIVRFTVITNAISCLNNPTMDYLNLYESLDEVYKKTSKAKGVCTKTTNSNSKIQITALRESAETLDSILKQRLKQSRDGTLGTKNIIGQTVLSEISSDLITKAFGVISFCENKITRSGLDIESLIIINSCASALQTHSKVKYDPASSSVLYFKQSITDRGLHEALCEVLCYFSPESQSDVMWAYFYFFTKAAQETEKFGYSYAAKIIESVLNEKQVQTRACANALLEFNPEGISEDELRYKKLLGISLSRGFKNYFLEDYPDLETTKFRHIYLEFLSRTSGDFAYTSLLTFGIKAFIVDENNITVMLDEDGLAAALDLQGNPEDSGAFMWSVDHYRSNFKNNNFPFEQPPIPDTFPSQLLEKERYLSIRHNSLAAYTLECNFEISEKDEIESTLLISRQTYQNTERDRSIGLTGGWVSFDSGSPTYKFFKRIYIGIACRQDNPKKLFSFKLEVKDKQNHTHIISGYLKKTTDSTEMVCHENIFKVYNHNITRAITAAIYHAACLATTKNLQSSGEALSEETKGTKGSITLMYNFLNKKLNSDRKIVSEGTRSSDGDFHTKFDPDSVAYILRYLLKPESVSELEVQTAFTPLFFLKSEESSPPYKLVNTDALRILIKNKSVTSHHVYMMVTRPYTYTLPAILDKQGRLLKFAKRSDYANKNYQYYRTTLKGDKLKKTAPQMLTNTQGESEMFETPLGFCFGVYKSLYEMVASLDTKPKGMYSYSSFLVAR